MVVKIGNERVIAENNITIIFKNNSRMMVDGKQAKFLYINPDEVKTVTIEEKVSLTGNKI